MVRFRAWGLVLRLRMWDLQWDLQWGLGFMIWVGGLEVRVEGLGGTFWC